jgi:hypothetical protein
MSCAGAKGESCPDAACAELARLRNGMLIGLRSLRSDALYKRRNGLGKQAMEQIDAAATLSREIFALEMRIAKRISLRKESTTYSIAVTH